MVELWFAVALAAAGFSFWLGFKYGKTWESNAFAEVSKIRAACASLGLKYETLIVGDLRKVQAELVKVLSFPAEKLKNL